MNSRPVVKRMDIASRKTYDRRELFRLVIQDGKLILDLNQCIPSRAIYIHKDKESVELTFKRKLLKRYSNNTDLEALESELLNHVDC